MKTLTNPEHGPFPASRPNPPQIDRRPRVAPAFPKAYPYARSARSGDFVDNALAVELDGGTGRGHLTVYFSYRTPIAFTYHKPDAGGEGGTVERAYSENLWSNTTGRHLTAAGAPSAKEGGRLDREKFEKRLAAAYAALLGIPADKTTDPSA